MPRFPWEWEICIDWDGRGWEYEGLGSGVDSTERDVLIWGTFWSQVETYASDTPTNLQG